MDDASTPSDAGVDAAAPLHPPGDADVDGGSRIDAGRCPAGLEGPDCVLTDPSLASLLPSVGALSPAFHGETTTYTLALPDDATSVSLSPSVTHPTHATITVDGVAVESGTASPSLARFRPIVVTVRTDGGALRSYTVVVTGIRGTYLKASNPGVTNELGSAIALSADGSTLAVGAWGEASSATGIDGDQTDTGASAAGAVYVFTRSGGGAWSQQAYIKASNASAGDEFGFAVALSADGSTLAVGASGEDSSATGVGGDQADEGAPLAGAVYVFTRADGTWSQQAYIKASNADVLDRFGRSLALSADGSTLAVGANGEASSATGVDGAQTNDAAAVQSGAVYVFTRTASGWLQEAYVKASNTGARELFGSAVALSADGATLAVGAWREASSATGVGGTQTNDDAPLSGAVYVFARAAGRWSQQAYVKASNTGVHDGFGYSVALSADGSTLAVGALGEDSSAADVGGVEDDDSAPDAGAVYVFARVDARWSQQAYIKSSNPDPFDNFGTAVSLSADGRTLAVGAVHEASSATGIDGDQTDDGAPLAGAVYVFARSTSSWSQQAYVKASNTGADDWLGYDVALSGDGRTLAIGAPYEDSHAAGVDGDQASEAMPSSGAVYVY